MITTLTDLSSAITMGQFTFLVGLTWLCVQGVKTTLEEKTRALTPYMPFLAILLGMGFVALYNLGIPTLSWLLVPLAGLFVGLTAVASHETGSATGMVLTVFMAWLNKFSTPSDQIRPGIMGSGDPTPPTSLSPQTPTPPVTPIDPSQPPQA